MDFFKIKERDAVRKGVREVYPDFQVTRSKDIMARGRSFYAVWNEETGLWSTDEYDVQRLVDEELRKYEVQDPSKYLEVHKRYLGDFSTNSWMQFRHYVANISDSYHQLDENLTFLNTEVKKEDYVSRRLPYALAEGDISAWDELVSTLYNPDERAKIEWAIGSIVAGDSKFIQKFIVFYGGPRTGKSTIINIIQKLFEGYISTFDAKALTGNNNQFGTEVFKSNPLVAIQHDGDLSKIEDNTKLNSIVSHEDMTVNEKNKPQYTMRMNAFLFMGSNKAVKITDAKSGIIRRLIDVHPTGELIPPRRYHVLMSQIDFELGAIAAHCLEVYRKMGKHYYDSYVPTEMMLQTDVFYNFIEASYEVFSEQNGTTLKQAYEMFKNWCDETGVEIRLPQYRFRQELRNYFDEFHDRHEMEDGTIVRSWYSGFNANKFKIQVKDDMVFSLVLEEKVSLFDELMKDCPAQYSTIDRKTGNSKPKLYWTNALKTHPITGEEFVPEPNQVVSTILSDLDTKKEHYVKIPEYHIVIDFDLTDENGEKSLEKNLEAASQWPPTYAELSKSGLGVHLHYRYLGDPQELSRIYEPGIEIKVFTGDTSLRRKLTACNNVPVANLNDGALPKKEKKVNDGGEQIKSEKALRELIERNLRKEIHPATKPSMDFIHHILEEAYKSDLTYDVTDMRNKLTIFANNSRHQSLYCLKLLQTMKWKSKDADDPKPAPKKSEPDAENPQNLVLFDVEVFPNLFVVCWKIKGSKNVVRMVNPTAQQVEALLPMKLVGFNNRRYDNHILYAAYMGFNNEQLFKLSQRIIDNVPHSTFGEAYNLSYTDIYDFSSEKKSLKQWEIDLGIKHSELGLPWDQPVPEDMWDKVVDYCADDVEATELVFDHLKEDFIARQILSELSGLNLNSTTQQHASKIIFGDDRRPQQKFVYTKLDTIFPGYQFDRGKSSYRGEEPGEGGYVYAEPGIYENVAVLDVASMHPTSIEELNLFGEYTPNFTALKQARIAIKRRDYEVASTVLNGKLKPFISEDDFNDNNGSKNLESLSYALKIVINSVYGLTAARFDNSFKDPRNIDNIVAKRGALFMINLKYMVQELGYQVIHIKTDSIKIPNADKTIIDAVMEYGQEYGYEFEHEATFEKMALVNDAVYIAKVAAGKKPAHWEAVGAQFQHPYVFKTLFSKEKLEFKDFCEAKNVQAGVMYLDFSNEDEAMALQKRDKVFVGKTGLFTPIQKGKGGGTLLRMKDDKYYAVTGTKGYEWMESDMVKSLNKDKDIDMSYFNKLVDDAVAKISQFGDFEWFVS